MTALDQTFTFQNMMLTLQNIKSSLDPAAALIVTFGNVRYLTQDMAQCMLLMMAIVYGGSHVGHQVLSDWARLLKKQAYDIPVCIRRKYSAYSYFLTVRKANILCENDASFHLEVQSQILAVMISQWSLLRGRRLNRPFKTKYNSGKPTCSFSNLHRDNLFSRHIRVEDERENPATSFKPILM